jgi:hypothetical protein
MAFNIIALSYSGDEYSITPETKGPDLTWTFVKASSRVASSGDWLIDTFHTSASGSMKSSASAACQVLCPRRCHRRFKD